MARWREVTAEEREAYGRDGAVVFRNVLPQSWIAWMRKAIDRILDNPGIAAAEYAEAGEGRFSSSFFMWLEDRDFRWFAFDSPLPALAADLLGSSEIRLFYDQLFVKEPATPVETPWHQDLSYWPFTGSDILSFWVPFDRVGQEEGAVSYLKGSHKDGVLYAPRIFGARSDYAALYSKSPLPPLPSLDDVDPDMLVSWDVKPGDVIAHHPLTLHHAPGNKSSDGRRRAIAVRYLGDDVRYCERPGTFVENPAFRGILPEPLNILNGAPVTGANFPVVWPHQSQARGYAER